VAALVEVQLLSGCRVGEVLSMRGCDLDLTGPVWVFRPARHKNRNRGIDRAVFLGPRAQAVVRPFLKTDRQAYLFSPSDAIAARDARRNHFRLPTHRSTTFRRRYAALSDRLGRAPSCLWWAMTGVIPAP
jgi:integrase